MRLPRRAAPGRPWAGSGRRLRAQATADSMSLPDPPSRRYAAAMDERSTRINVGQLPQGRFLAHGELQVWHHARLLCYEAGGPFNVEMVGAMSRAVGRLLREWQPTEPYVAVTWWHGSLLASPDVLEAYHDLLRLGRQVMAPELACLWQIGPEIEDAAFMKPLWKQVHDACGYRLEFCDTDAAMLRRASELLRQAGIEDSGLAPFDA